MKGDQFAMAETETATSNHLLSALRPRSLTSEAVLLCWIAWFLFRCIGHLFRFLADHDIYSAILRAYDDAPLMLLDSIIGPAIVYGLFQAGGTVRRSTAGHKRQDRQCPMCAEGVRLEATKCGFCGTNLPLPSGIGESVPPHDLVRRGLIAHAFIWIFPRLTAVFTGRQTGSRAAAGQAGAALDTKRLAGAWLLIGVVPIAFGYTFHPVGWLVSGDYSAFVTAFIYVWAVVFFFWRWPQVFGLSRLRPRVGDLAVGALGGYLCTNVIVLIPAIPIAWPLATTWSTGSYSRHLELLFVCHVLVIPAGEELFSRGVILASLCKRMPVPWAVLITSVAATVLHLPPTRWLSIFVAWLILCGIYLARDRSLPASIAAHTVTNALAWFPNLVVAGHFLK
jgi:membrane protease YdiL (CAAX protease family)